MRTSLVRAICFDWGDTLMLDQGPRDIPMALWPEVHVIPGAKETLEHLHKRYPLCIATNAVMSKKPMVELALERGGLRDYFSHIFTFTELGVKKDSPIFWNTVATAVGVKLEELAMIGDTLESDVLAPARFGVQTVWLNRQLVAETPPVGIQMVTRLQEFSALF